MTGGNIAGMVQYNIQLFHYGVIKHLYGYVQAFTALG